MDDSVLDALQGVEGLADDVFASLGQDLDRDIIRNHIVIN